MNQEIFDVSDEMKDFGFTYRHPTDSEMLQKAEEICEFHRILHDHESEEPAELEAEYGSIYKVRWILRNKEVVGERLD